jgi:putative ABC transport system permease protein
MSLVRSVPLAWKNLAHDRVRFALFAAGIGFAVVLMGVQLGIMNAMLDGNTALIKRFNGELILVNPNKAALIFREGVSRRRVGQAAGVPGVRSAHPVYLDYHLGMLRHTADDPAARTQTRRVRVVGLDPNSGVLDLPGVSPADWAKLNAPDTALYDRRTRKDPLHPDHTVFGKFEPGVTTELAGREVTLVGGFDLGFDFGCDGTLVVSDRTFSQALREPYYPVGPMAEVDLVVVKLEPGVDVDDVRSRLRAEVGTGGDVDVLTRDELVSRERAFWQRNTPIGFSFGAGVVLGFVVGLVICYQILAGDVADHMPEYATLKAIGYPNRYLSLVVLQESLVLAAAGFIPGMLATVGLYAVLTEWTGLPMRLTPGRFGLILGLTIVMCVLSGLLALRKAKKVDPADVF